MDPDLMERIAVAIPAGFLIAWAALMATGFARRDRHVPPPLASLAELGAFDRLRTDQQRRVREALQEGLPGETPEEAASIRTLANGELRTQFNPWYFAAQTVLFSGIGLQGLRWILDDPWSFWGGLSRCCSWRSWRSPSPGRSPSGAAVTGGRERHLRPMGADGERGG